MQELWLLNVDLKKKKKNQYESMWWDEITCCAWVESKVYSIALITLFLKCNAQISFNVFI